MLYLAKILIHKMKTFFQNIVKIFVGTFRALVETVPQMNEDRRIKMCDNCLTSVGHELRVALVVFSHTVLVPQVSLI